MPDTDFEKIRKNMDNKINKKSSNTDTQIFSDLIFQNSLINEQADTLIYDIDNIVNSCVNEIKINITFKSILTSLKLSISEYKYAEQLFKKYTVIYSEIYNEENTVKVLEILRQIISERRVILSSITDNLIKLQRLTNERDKFNTDDNTEDFEKYISPETF